MVNLDNISYIEDSTGKKAVILSIEIFEQIKEQLEELEDIDAFIKAKQKNQESLPIDIVELLILGDQSKIKTMREYRGYSLNKLAKLLAISEAYLSQIENKKRLGSVKLYKELARILNTEIELLTD